MHLFCLHQLSHSRQVDLHHNILLTHHHCLSCLFCFDCCMRMHSSALVLFLSFFIFLMWCRRLCRWCGAGCECGCAADAAARCWMLDGCCHLHLFCLYQLWHSRQADLHNILLTHHHCVSYLFCFDCCMRMHSSALVLSFFLFFFPNVVLATVLMVWCRM